MQNVKGRIMINILYVLAALCLFYGIWLRAPEKCSFIECDRFCYLFLSGADESCDRRDD